MAIARGEFDNFKKLVEQNYLDVDAFIDNKNYTPVLMEILLSRGISDENNRLTMLHYVLDKGANPNTKCKAGYNCLHIAARQPKLAKALDLFLDFNGDVNCTDENGATVAYWAIQSFPWRTQGADRQVHLNLIERIVMLGASLDHKNKFGSSPRDWLARTSEDVKALVAGCEKLNPVYKPGTSVQPKFPTHLQNPEIAQKIWKELVPPIGQAGTVQGELLRAIEKLRDEAQRNGNINFSNSHKLLAQFISDSLINSTLFDKNEMAKIKSECKKLMKASDPYTEDDVYDYLTDQVCVFFQKNKDLIQHEMNPEIIC